MTMDSSRNANGGAAIAIVGMGCRFADAPDLHAYWELIRAGKDAFREPPASRWDHDAFFDDNPRAAGKSYAPAGAWIEDVESFPAVAMQIPPRRVEVMDPQQRLLLEVAMQAIEDSGKSADEIPRRTGVYMGISAMEYREIMLARVSAQMMASGRWGDAPEDPNVVAQAVNRIVPERPFSATGSLANMAAATVAQEFRLTGPAYTTDAACSSALVALSAAVDALRAGTVDAALAGGAYLCLMPDHHVAFSRVGAMSKQGKCLPFDARADGFVQGDGGGVVLLKRLDDALEAGDRIYAVINGVGMNNDGGGEGPMAPVKKGQVEVINLAWNDAGVDPGKLGYMEAHGTGTFVGDKIEFDGLMEAIGEHVQHAAIGSSKANIGHTMSGAGIAGLIRAVLAIHHRELPPMANFESPKDTLGLEGSPFFIPKEVQTWDRDERVAAISSFGFGGTNVHAVVSSYETPEPESTEQAELVCISSHDSASLRDLAARTATSIRRNPNATVAGVARAWNMRREQAVRVGVVASTTDELADRLAAFGAGELPEGVAYGTALQDAKVAFMYPGQGAQRIDMIAGIRDRFDVVSNTLDRLDAASDGALPMPVSHFLYPERRAEKGRRRISVRAADCDRELPARSVRRWHGAHRPARPGGCEADCDRGPQRW